MQTINFVTTYTIHPATVVGRFNASPTVDPSNGKNVKARSERMAITM